MTKIIAIGSGKGGVGKSMVSANLAIALGQKNLKVGLIDADIYGPSQAKILGQEHVMVKYDDNNKVLPLAAYGIKFISISSIIGTDKPLILRAPLVTKLANQLLTLVNWGELDYLLIDLPPGTGDIQLTIAQNANLTAAIIVTTPQEMAINIAEKGLKMFERLNIPIAGIIENMSGFTCSNCQSINHIFTSKINEFLINNQTILLGSIPLDPDIANSCDQGQQISNSNRDIFRKIAANLQNSTAIKSLNDRIPLVVKD